MRRTSISLAIVALLLCGQGFGQAVGPLGESLAPGVAEPIPGALLPVPGAARQVPSTVPPAPTATPQPATTPQFGVNPLQGQGQRATTYSSDPGMLQPQPMTDDYPVADGSNVWNQPMLEGPCDQACTFPGCALCGAGLGCPNSWYVDQRVRIMTHPRPRAKEFGSWRNFLGYNTFGQAVYGYTPATSSLSLPFDLSSSYEVTLGHYLGLDTYNRDHFLEFTFYGTNHWGEGGSVLYNVLNNAYLDANNNVVDPYTEAWTKRVVYGNIYGGSSDAAGFNRATAQWSEYKSSLNNFEVNLQMRPRAKADRLVLHKNGKWRRQCQQGVFCNWLAGARLFSMNESYMFYSTADFTYFDNNGDVINRPKATGAYQTRTKNTLLGLQIGPDWTYRNCRAEFGLGVKFAGYINFAEQETGINISGAESDVLSDQQDLNVNGSVAKNTCATSIQMNFHAAYKVRPNFILKADYELLYMAGLALAPEQVNLGFDESLDIATGGSLLFQSAMLGAEYSW